MAKKTTTTDAKTLELIQLVKRQKEEIAQAERPNWITNCSFSYGENGSAPISLHVEANVRSLVLIVAFLLDKERTYGEAATRLGVDAPAFQWGGFAVGDWIEDVKMRINKIQIAQKRKKLEALEERLNRIVSPELRAKMELEIIESELGG